MPEVRRPRPHEAIPDQPKQSWDIGAISGALQATPEPSRDIAHGPGIRYALAEGALSVELFPPHAERTSGIVRLSTVDSRHEFHRQPHPAIGADGIIVASPTHQITLSPTGELLTFRLVLAEGPVSPSDASAGDDEPIDADEGDQALSGDSVTAERVMPDPSPTPGTGQHPRVTYGGRLGTDPRTKVTPKGTFVMEFPVAVAVEGQDRPEWRDTVVFERSSSKASTSIVWPMSTANKNGMSRPVAPKRFVSIMRPRSPQNSVPTRLRRQRRHQERAANLPNRDRSAPARLGE
jgi:hypothetical protein